MEIDGIDKTILMLELDNSHCELNHGPNVDTSKIKAVDYLTIPVGDIKTGVVDNSFVIPICEECAEGLVDPEWVLIYCLECMSSQWVYKPLAKYRYKDNLIIVAGCIKCTGNTKIIFSG